eukprot:scaffold139845_cov160-Phaeocystis_antarctica.AAC.1
MRVHRTARPTRSTLARPRLRRSSWRSGMTTSSTRRGPRVRPRRVRVAPAQQGGRAAAGNALRAHAQADARRGVGGGRALHRASIRRPADGGARPAHPQSIRAERRRLRALLMWSDEAHGHRP